MKRLALAALAAACAGIVLFWTFAADGERVSIPYDSADRVAEGRALYGEYCAACHGVDLEGQPDWQARGADGKMPAPPHDATGHTWHHADELLFRITKLGSAAVVGGGYQSDMMGFGDALTDAEILSVLAYIKSTWPARVIEMHNRLNAEAQ